MDKLQDIRGVAFDLDGTLVDSAPGLAAAVDMALYALELPTAGEDRVITWIGNGADVLMERALAWARQERATLRKTMGKPPVDDEIPAEEQVRILRKLFDRYYGDVAEEGTFLFPHVADTLGALHAKGLPLGLVTNKPTPFVAPLLEALDIAKYFSVVIGGDDVQNKSRIPIRCCWWQSGWASRLNRCSLWAIRVTTFRLQKRLAARRSASRTATTMANQSLLASRM